MNDYAGLLAPAERAALERLLAEGERHSGVQMVVALFPSLEGEDLETVSLRLAERWRIGQRGLDNGVVLVVFVRERRVRLEVGYGLEPALTDAVAARIIREEIAPRFRQGRYAEGLEAAARAVFRVAGASPAAGRRRPPPTPRPSAPPGAPGWPALALGAVLLVVLVAVVLVALGDRPGAWTVGSRRRAARRVVLPARGFGGPEPWGGGWPSGGGVVGGGGRFGGGGASGSW